MSGGWGGDAWRVGAMFWRRARLASSGNLVIFAFLCIHTHDLRNDMNAREVMQRLRREGFQERPGKGAHRVFRRGDVTVVVSAHR
jgi:hypothetical protein